MTKMEARCVYEDTEKPATLPRHAMATSNSVTAGSPTAGLFHLADDVVLARMDHWELKIELSASAAPLVVL